jgi:hypothetical protein
VVSTLQTSRKCSQLDQKFVLQESFLNVLRVPFFTLVETADPVIIKCVVFIKPISNIGPNTGEIDVSLSHQMVEKHSHRVIPGILNWTEQPAGEVVLQPPSISRIRVKGRVGRFVCPVVQETRNT